MTDMKMADKFAGDLPGVKLQDKNTVITMLTEVPLHYIEVCKVFVLRIFLYTHSTH